MAGTGTLNAVGGLMDVLAYVRVSTEEQGRSGLGAEAQRAAIAHAAEARGWTVVEWIEDEASGKSLKRPGIQRALALMEDGGPDVLVAAKLDRLARSALDFLSVVRRAEDKGWSLIVLDTGRGSPLDMTDPYGKFTATVMAGVAELERELISRRTAEALAAAKAAGTHVGRPPYGLERNPARDDDEDAPQFRVRLDVCDITSDGDGLSGEAYVEAKGRLLALTERIRAMREEGATLQDIADWLNEADVPTSTGRGRWYPRTVSNFLRAISDGLYRDERIVA